MLHTTKLSAYISAVGPDTQAKCSYIAHHIQTAFKSHVAIAFRQQTTYAMHVLQWNTHRYGGSTRSVNFQKPVESSASREGQTWNLPDRSPAYSNHFSLGTGTVLCRSPMLGKSCILFFLRPSVTAEVAEARTMPTRTQTPPQSKQPIPTPPTLPRMAKCASHCLNPLRWHLFKAHPLFIPPNRYF